MKVHELIAYYSPSLFKPLSFTAVDGAATIKLTTVGSPTSVSLDISTDNGESWHTYTIGSDINLTDGQTVLLSGNNNHFSTGQNNYYKFTMIGSVGANGNIQSLMNFSNLCPEYCYRSLFDGCSGLLTTPQLPATGLGIMCYRAMFANCSSLLATSELPASQMNTQCYQYMFNNCKALTAAPALPATSLAQGCYYGMFAGCDSLTNIPSTLMATTLAQSCYDSMFQGCSSLIYAPQLPATTIAGSCYAGMFKNCTNLIIAPQTLPATELCTNCYNTMFQGCTNLSTAPYLPATGLVTTCYQGMFYACSHLNSLSVAFTDWAENLNATKDWVNSITNDEGTFYKPDELTAVFDYSHIPVNWKTNEEEEPVGIPLTFTNVGTLSTVVQLNNQGAYEELSGIDLHYCINGGDWEDYSINLDIVLQPGDTVAISGNNSTFSKDTSKWYRFQAGTDENGKVAISGNIMSLLGFRDTCPDYCFYQLFVGNTFIDSASIELPATTIGAWSYANMFQSCTSLVNGPEQIAATHLQQYSCYQMFYYCISLTSAPSLKAVETASNCCQWMFYGCIALVTVPANMLPAEIAQDYCYYGMFQGCTSLTAAPNLPANYISQYSYRQMFYNCTSLLVPPQSIGAHLGPWCCWEMFMYCNSLTAAPQLKATTLPDFCYYEMFINCDSLTSIPVLSATTIGNNSYLNMFASCDGIKQVTSSQLPLTVLPSTCYVGIFASCWNLSSISVPFSSWNDQQGSTASWVDGVASTGIFTGPSSLQLIMNKSHIPPGWRVFDTEGNERFPVYEPLTFKAVGGTSQISFNKVNNPNTLKSIKYSINDGAWQDYSVNTIVTLNQGDTMAMSGANTQSTFSKDTTNYYQFAMTGLVDCSGTVGSLFYYDDNMYITTGGVTKLFAACTGLLTAPKLPFWSLGPSACAYMFQDCWSLTSVPTFRFGNYSSRACLRMFDNCSSLLSASPISFGGGSAGITHVFDMMYRNCYSLTGAVSLTGIGELHNASFNFYYTFQNCSGITDAYLYRFSPLNDEEGIFNGCKSLSSITTDLSGWSNGGYGEWTRNVANQGIFYKLKSLSSVYGTSYIPSNWSVINTDDVKQPLTFKAVSGATTVAMERCGTITTAIEMKYKKNDGDWQDFIDNQTVISLNQNETVSFSGAATNYYTNIDGKYTTNYRRFITTGYYELSGNLQSLVEYSQRLLKWQLGPMFTRNPGLVKAPDVLPAKRILQGNYECLFYQCTNLKVAPFLALEYNWGNGNMAGMFRGCTSLTHMNSGILCCCFSYCSHSDMFNGCTSLTSAPDLYIFGDPGSHTQCPSMFRGCTALSTPPAFLNMSGKTLDCGAMFAGCTSLTATPPGLQHLHAHSNMNVAGFRQMFSGCINLVQVPEYMDNPNPYMLRMFKGCSKLKKAPELRGLVSIADAPNDGLKEMFAGCSSLTSISVAFTDWGGCTQDWVSGVAPTGDFECPTLLPIFIGQSYIPVGWTVNGQETGGGGGGSSEQGDVDYGNALTFIAKTNNAVVTFSSVGSPTNIQIYYSENHNEWQLYSLGSVITLTNIGDSVAFSGSTSTLSQGTNNYYKFGSDSVSRFEVSGNVMSLVNFATTIDYQWQFYNLFANNEAILNTPQLPSQVLQSHCYRSMFDKCHNLTAACQFPYFTTNIKQSALRSMFYDCYNMVTGPSAIRCTTETAETECCKFMFYGCTALTGAVTLNQSTLNTNCYQSMFENCNALTGITVAFTSWGKCAGWVNGITNNVGVFTKPADLVATKGNSYIPSNWLAVDGTAFDENMPLTFTAKTAANIALSTVGSPSAISLQYSKNNGTWTNYTTGTVIELASGDTLAFSGNNDHFSKTSANYYYFTMNGTIEADGNIQSLMNFSDSCTNWCYYSLFSGCASLTQVPSILPATTLANSCYKNLFRETQIVTPPELPATELQNNCYESIFKDCHNLVSVPTNYLPVTDLAQECYRGMFMNCSSIVAVPSLPATGLANSCCRDMFNGCTTLKTPPVLSATTLANSCYYCMFTNCTSLTSAPTLPATTLANSCYQAMFYNCTSLSTAPDLPASTLTPDCYVGMFRGCNHLTTPPSLPATGLANSCYAEMFRGCSNLSTLTVAFTDWREDINATTNWVEGINTIGTITKPEELNKIYDASHIPINWTVAGDEQEETISEDGPLTFLGKAASNAVCLSSTGSPTGTFSFQYKKNDGAWTNYTTGTVIQFNTGETVSFSGANEVLSQASGKSFHFKITGTVDAYGNIQSLLNFSNTAPQKCFYAMFSGCTGLNKAPQISATTVNTDSYNKMFSGCVGLTTPPLSLPATTLPQSCCKEMFKGCNHLTAAPVIAATTFTGSQSIQYMFSGCTNLSSVEVAFTTWPGNNATTNWLQGTPNDSNCTFTKPAALVISTRNTSYVPSNWTLVDK